MLQPHSRSWRLCSVRCCLREGARVQRLAILGSCRGHWLSCRRLLRCFAASAGPCMGGHPSLRKAASPVAWLFRGIQYPTSSAFPPWPQEQELPPTPAGAFGPAGMGWPASLPEPGCCCTGAGGGSDVLPPGHSGGDPAHHSHAVPRARIPGGARRSRHRGEHHCAEACVEE